MHVVVSGGMGAAGEVLPFIALGAELAARGHRVDFVGNPYYASSVAEAGLSFIPVGSTAHHEGLLSDTGLFGPVRKGGLDLLEEHYFPYVGDIYHAIEQAVHGGATMIVGSDVGAISVAEKYRLPRARVVLSPSRLGSRSDPSHPEGLLPPWARWFGKTGRRLSLFHRLRNLRRGRFSWPPHESPVFPEDHPIALVRSRAGLVPFSETRHRAGLILCQWPEWFAAPQPDWPARAVASGFIFSPRPKMDTTRESHPSRTEPSLAPIVATTGSLAAEQFKFFSAVVAASVALGRPAILVTPHRDHVPVDLPPTVTYLNHAPFGDLFGRAALVIHHGGIGTMAYALAAGVPQIVMPLRGEQFDIANRATRLGVARMLSVERIDPDQLIRALRFMLGSDRVARRCRYWQSRFTPDDGRRQAVDRIEALAAG